MALFDQSGWYTHDPETIVITPTDFHILFQLASDGAVHVGLEVASDRVGTFVMTLKGPSLLDLWAALDDVVNATPDQVEALKTRLRDQAAQQ